jgi:hypothetical protein
MRQPTEARRLQEFLRQLGRRAGSRSTTVYLVGGATAVLEGWRETTVDVDLHFDPESDEALRALVELKERLKINVELTSPLDFLPELPGWRDRSPYVAQEGALTVRHFDPYSQALAKLERGFDQDLRDVKAMIERGLVEPTELAGLLEAIEDELYRFPTVDGRSLAEKVRELDLE